MEDIRKAIAYNKSKHNKSRTKAIQRVVGVKDDGMMGPDTVMAIMSWQRDNGLKPDGKVGRITLDLMRYCN